ncbi:motility-associated protein, partial [Escherichia coli]|uniref:motility-associated protein n=1 Tax=Escherichia coli TaxID=562 RepID=UPI003C6DB00B
MFKFAGLPPLSPARAVPVRARRSETPRSFPVFLIIGYVIILAASLGTYAVHGSLAALWVPMEYIAIIGLMIGGFVAGNGPKAI